jgi:hypothetical protein
MVLLAFRRWGPPLISVVFASGLQLSNAIQEDAGWALIVLACVLAALYIWIERRVEATGATTGAASLLQVDRDESINITTHNQSGGTNIGKVSVERPQPDICGADTLAHHEKTETGYRSVVALQLQDQFAAQALEVVVVGTTVTGLEVKPDAPASKQLKSEEPLTPQRGGITVHPPLHDRYIVTVTTERPDPNLKIHAQIR